jgi:hypothetical protein
MSTPSGILTMALRTTTTRTKTRVEKYLKQAGAELCQAQVKLG